MRNREELTTRDANLIRKALKKAVKDLQAICYEPPLSIVPAKETEGLFKVSGIALEYNNYNYHKHLFLPGCLDEWIEQKETVPLLFEHTSYWQHAGNVSVFQSTEAGIRIETVLYDNAMGRDMKRLILAGVIDSLSPTYHFCEELNPEGTGGYTRMKKVNHLSEISFVLRSAGEKTLLTTAKKDKTESDYRDYFERLENFWKVKRDLEVPEVHDFILNEWFRCENQIINHNYFIR